MSERKTWVRVFTIADYEEEEIWLRRQHKQGWKLVKMTPPCFFLFERCAPEDVIYRLDYQNNKEGGDYFQIFRDYGWEPCGRCMGWLYFRKPAAQADSEQDGELFSDNASRIDMVDHIVKTRTLPLLVIFLCCVIPNFMRSVRGGGDWSIGFTVFWSVMLLLYLILFLHCGGKLRALREKYDINK